MVVEPGHLSATASDTQSPPAPSGELRGRAQPVGWGTWQRAGQPCQPSSVPQWCWFLGRKMQRLLSARVGPALPSCCHPVSDLHRHAWTYVCVH